MVDSLEAAGLVTRRRDPNDRRRYQLALTAKGRRQARETQREIEAATDHVLRHLDPAERDTLSRLARKALGLGEAGTAE
jgi:DNA-binding MarR family transcriptional regulator